MSDLTARDWLTPGAKRRTNARGPVAPHLRRAAAEPSASPLVTTIVTPEGVRQGATAVEVRELVASGKFFWIDLVGGEAARASVLEELGVEPADLAWMQRFGQAGRMAINPHRLRAVTWLSEGFGHGLTEIHVLCFRKSIITVWNGGASALDEIREHFAERMSGLETSPGAAAAILMQLLLGTLHHGISEVDARLQDLQTQLRTSPDSVDFTTLQEQMQRLQSAWSDVDRYSSAVNTAIIGVEALPGVDQRGADELNDYADQVEDLEHRLQERSRWGSELLSDYATALAQRQGEQISRLTIVSLIFLPITFLTGFFGMNFNWMIDAVKAPWAFAALGVLRPALCVLVTVVWLRRRGLV